MPEIATVCPYCGCGCGLYLQVREGLVVGVSPSRRHPISQGRLCVKGWHAHEVAANPNRLIRPLIRREGGLVEASWEEAIEAVARGLKGVLGAQGPGAVGVLGSARCANEDNYVLARFARCTLGTPNIDCSARIQYVQGAAEAGSGAGAAVGAGEIADLDGSDLILLVGSDPTEEHPAVAARIYRALQRGARVVAASGRRHPLARLAHLDLRVRPGAELSLLASLLHVLLVENEMAAEGQVEGLAELRASVADLGPEKTQAATGVSPEAVREAAQLYLASKQVAVLYSAGLALSPSGSASAQALGNLAALGAAGAGPNVSVLGLLSRNNLQGCRDMGVTPDLLPGYVSPGDDAAAGKFEQAWGGELNRETGLSAWEMLGRVRALYIMGDDVTRSLPDGAAARAALDGLDFLVVQDLFMSPAAALADVVLPAAAFAERNGTFTNLERRVQAISQAVNPPGEAREDWRIIADVSRAMGKPLPYETAGDVLEEIAALVPMYGGMSYGALKGGEGSRWSGEAGGVSRLTPLPAEAGEGKAETSEEYPLLLAADPTLRPWDGEVTVSHTLTAAGEFTVVARDYPDGMLCLNPEDARRLGVRGGRPARVVSPKGEVKMKVRVTEDAPAGVALLPYNQATRIGLMEVTTEPATGRPVLAPTPVSVGPVQ